MLTIKETEFNLNKQQDGEYLIAYLTKVEIRQGGSFVDDKTKKEFIYKSATKLIFSITQVSHIEMANTKVAQEKQKEIQALIVQDDDVQVLKDYKDFRLHIAAKFLIKHKGISVSSGNYKLNIDTLQDVLLIDDKSIPAKAS